MSQASIAARYVGWLERRFWLVVAVALLATSGSVWLARHRLPLFADFSYLLPQDATAVRDLRKLEARTSARDTARVLVVAPDAVEREAVTRALVAGFRTISLDLVQGVADDDAEIRGYFSKYRHLFVPLTDLEDARDSLSRKVARAKAKANPLFIELDDEPDANTQEQQRDLDKLRARRTEAEAKLAKSGYVSADGKTGLIAVKTTFVKTDVASGKRLLVAMSTVRTSVLADHPAVRIGLTGGIFLGVAEHEALLRGMLRSSIITALLVAAVLFAFFRSVRMLSMLTITLLVGTTCAFGAAALTVGHLNAATAFLGAIIAGNGVNYGIFLIARYREARRGEVDARAALALAIANTVRPTLVASLAASIAYGALAETSFRGFADFAIIGAVGMALCWIASYTLLPALVVRWGMGAGTADGAWLGRALVRVFGFRRPLAVVVVGCLASTIAAVITYRYVKADPFEYDVKNLRSEGRDAVEGREWMKVSDASFGRSIASKTYIAADRIDQVPQIVAALHAVDAGQPEARKTIGTVQSVLDVIPPDQDDKLAVLKELRSLLDDGVLDQLDDAQRSEALALRPPDELRPVTVADLPHALADGLPERDGTIGKLIAVRPAASIDEWNGRDLIRFASAVRRLQLPNGETVTTSGSNVIFADIITTIRGDGLVVTALAAGGLVLMVLVVVGRNRRSVAVLVATAVGALALVATSALVGLKVTFLDFVALPITLGLGIDYAINVAHRALDPADDPLTPLRTGGPAVFVCSLTTMIGYGSLLVSDNLAIRGFGLASLIGEVTCLVAALALVPSLLALRFGGRAARARVG